MLSFGRWLLLALVLNVTARGADAPSGIHASSPGVKAALTETIQGQLAAFRGNDFAKAYTFASREIRSAYTAADFEGMVRTAYPVIARSSAAEFGDALDGGEDALIDVHISSASEHKGGQFRYRLHKEEDGKWRITGVLEVKPVGLSV